LCVPDEPCQQFALQHPRSAHWPTYDAVADGIKRASKTIRGISGAWVADQEVAVKSGKIVEYKVRLKLTFVLDEKK
jgi:flavin-binding protein dodecin